MMGMALRATLAASAAFLAPSAVRWPGYVNFLWLYWAGRPCPMDERLAGALRELGVVGTNVDSYWSPHEFNAKFGFYFYVGHTAGKGWLYLRKADWKRVWEKYWQTRDKFVCVRPKCFSDPKTMEEMKAQIRRTLERHKGAGPLAYALDDEISYTSYANPLDFCFSPHCLRRFREWLRRRYGTLDALNRTWGTSFRTWEEVVPLSTDEIRAREYPKGMGRYNFSPWSDHLDFVDELFPSVVAELVRFVHELDPGVPCGFVGGQAPSAWGGYDWWRLSRVVDFLEAYDIGNAMEIVRSFAPRRYPMVETIFVPPEPEKGKREAPRLIHKVWRGVAHGYFGHIIWCAHNYFPEGDPERPSEGARALAPTFRELTKARWFRDFMRARFEHDGIGIYYSQPSIRAHWMLDSKLDGKTWPRRFSSWEREHSSIIKDRDAWTKAVEDLWLQYRFVSYEEVKRGALLREGFKVLIMPKTIALSDEEARAIWEFVSRGGTVVADYQTGLFDERLRSRPSGALDGLFGIERRSFRVAERYGDLKPMVEGRFVGLIVAEPDIMATTGRPRGYVKGVPCVIERRFGKGWAVYLNLGVMEYRKLRLEGKGEEFLGLLSEILGRAGVRPKFGLYRGGGPLRGYEITRWRLSDGRLLLFVLNNGRVEEGPRFKATLKAPRGRVENLRTGANFGVVSTFYDLLSPFEANVYMLSEAG